MPINFDTYQLVMIWIDTNGYWHLPISVALLGIHT